MRLVVQRVIEASVTIDGQCIGEIGAGMAVLVGVGQGDTKLTADRLLEKLLNLRIFADENGKMNRSIVEIGGALLLVSQFTLYADCRKGRRPSFTGAATPDLAREVYDYFVAGCRATGLGVACGVFAADMKVSLINDGPVTILLDSRELDQ